MRKTYKLWILTFLLMVIAGFLTLKQDVIKLHEHESKEGPVEIETTDIDDGGIIQELKDDFIHTKNVISDLFHTIKTGESEFNSGLDVLRKKEDISGYEDTAAIKENEENEKESPAESSNLEKVTLKYVVDGDTIIVISGEKEVKVRFIGIDTPESVHPDESKNTEWGIYASDHTKAILAGVDTLYLEYDVEQTDVYGRTLAYVWLTEDTNDLKNMLNAQILSDGYALNKEYPPNVKYAAEFKKLCEQAKGEKTGLWIEPEFVSLWE